MTNLEVAKIHALWRALKLCVEPNFAKVEFEVMLLRVVRAVNGKEAN